MRQTMRMLSGLVLISALAVSSARASVGGEEVALVGTTVAGHTAHVHGHIDVTVPGLMVFRANASAGKAAAPELSMPYDKVFEFGLTQEDAFHLGFFPAMFYGMVAPRPQRHVFTVSWHDAEGHGQEATFEISKDFSQVLVPVMYARARSACVRKEFTHEYSTCTPVVPPPLPPRVPLTPAAPPPTPPPATIPATTPAVIPSAPATSPATP